jgi:hypothetical protein
VTDPEATGAGPLVPTQPKSRVDARRTRIVNDDGAEVVVALIKQNIGFVRRYYGWHPQDRRVTAFVPIIADGAALREISWRPYRQVSRIQLFLLEVIGNLDFDANKAWGQGIALPVNQVLKHGE